MKRIFTIHLLLLPVLLTGCGTVGTKTVSMDIIYGITAALSLLILIWYCSLIPKKELWFLLLFSSVLIVNLGYFCLSISKTLEEALLANRIAYLGSVFLPLAMLMIIIDVIGISYKRWFPLLLLVIGIFIFLVAASPGYLTIYYQEVSLETIQGGSVLQKVYGPWHSLYLFYLLGYFAGMTAIIIRTMIKKELKSTTYVMILAGAVFVNLGVWLIEQLVHIDFEILSISYIISELFLLGLHILMLENERLKENIEEIVSEKPSVSEDSTEEIIMPEEKEEVTDSTPLPLITLTKTERIIFDFYISGKTTKEILAELNITENTLKFHNKNIYSKLGVSSRKQLIEQYTKWQSEL